MFEMEFKDVQDLSTITALNLDRYLRHTDWDFQGMRGRNARVFTTHNAERRWTVTVPVTESLDDHAERIYDALRILAEAEGRDLAFVAHDLATVDNDSIRITSTNGLGSKPLTINQTAELLRDANDVMANTARAAESAAVQRQRAAFRGQFSAQVAAYLSDLTFFFDHERGYDLIIHSPVTMQLDQTPDFGEDAFRAPFARYATMTLTQALEAARRALGESVDTWSTAPFRNTVNLGVSANLCDALARLAKNGEGVAIDVTWSLLRGSSGPSGPFSITRQQADILQSAAAELRRAEPSLGERVYAHVTKLHRELDEFDGRATLIALWDGKNVRMDAEFDRDVYDMVIEAFQQQSEISVVGDIYPSPAGIELRSPIIVEPQAP